MGTLDGEIHEGEMINRRRKQRFAINELMFTGVGGKA